MATLQLFISGKLNAILNIVEKKKNKTCSLKNEEAHFPIFIFKDPVYL